MRKEIIVSGVGMGGGGGGAGGGGFYFSSMSYARVKFNTLNFFVYLFGIRQGCGISLALFSLFISLVSNHVAEIGKHGVQMMSQSLYCLQVMQLYHPRLQ